MSDAPTPPQPGQPLWGDDLNTYLLSLEARIAANEERFAVQVPQIADLDTRVTALEAKPEYVLNTAPWQFSNAAPPATGNQVRLNNADPKLATLIDFRRLDSDSADRTPWLQALTSDSFIRIQDWDNASVYHRFMVSSATLTSDATNVQVSVVWESGSGTLPNAKVDIGFLVSIDLP